jgi:subfamily B ATP-binding cassette protein MsbA
MISMKGSGVRGMRGGGGREGAGRSAVAVRTDDPAQKKKVDYSNAWPEAKALVVAHRGRLAIGLVLMLINRVAGLVLPATSKYLIDDVIGKRQAQMRSCRP